MSFNLEKNKQEEISRFIKNSSIFKTEWDIYYLGLIMGFAHGKPLPIDKQHKFIDKFIIDYEPQQSNLLALLLTCYADSQGVKTDDRKQIMKLVNQLFDYRNSTNLSDKSRSDKKDFALYGSELMNNYANRGLEIIANEIEFSGEPHYFLTDYFILLQKYLKKRNSQS